MALSGDMSRFDGFERIQANYKIIQDHAVRADVLIPKSLDKSAGKRPVLLRWHGGFLIASGSMFPDFLPLWLLEYALSHSAVFVNANYRLLPESTGAEVLSDMEDLLAWIESDLPILLAAHNVQIDLSRLLVAGESAGGYLSVQSGLSRPDLVKAVIALYPMLDFDPSVYITKGRKPILGNPEYPTSWVEDHIKNMPLNADGRPKPISDDDPPTRVQLAIASAQQGRIPDFLGTSEKLFPMKRVLKEPFTPVLLIIHGEDDSAVPVEGSRKFVQLLGNSQPDTRVSLWTQPGEHGFDVSTTLEDTWLRDGLRPVTKAWLR
ncbi:MAG: hypothetical protein Q9157_007176 [Trypethelium eluteriae]